MHVVRSFFRGFQVGKMNNRKVLSYSFLIGDYYPPRLIRCILLRVITGGFMRTSLVMVKKVERHKGYLSNVKGLVHQDGWR